MGSNDAVVIAALGIVSVAVTALVWIVKFLMKEMRKTLDKNTASNVLVAEKTAQNTKYLKERNGRDAEMHDERRIIHEQQMNQEKQFFGDMVVHLQHLKESDIELTKAITQVKKKLDK